LFINALLSQKLFPALRTLRLDSLDGKGYVINPRLWPVLETLHVAIASSSVKLLPAMSRLRELSLQLSVVQGQGELLRPLVPFSKQLRSFALTLLHDLSFENVEDVLRPVASLPALTSVSLSTHESVEAFTMLRLRLGATLFCRCSLRVPSYSRFPSPVCGSLSKAWRRWPAARRPSRSNRADFRPGAVQLGRR
jgi:hypothetical protein